MIWKSYAHTFTFPLRSHLCEKVSYECDKRWSEYGLKDNSIRMCAFAQFFSLFICKSLIISHFLHDFVCARVIDTLSHEAASDMRHIFTLRTHPNVFHFELNLYWIHFQKNSVRCVCSGAAAITLVSKVVLFGQNRLSFRECDLSSQEDLKICSKISFFFPFNSTQFGNWSKNKCYWFIAGRKYAENGISHASLCLKFHWFCD